MDKLYGRAGRILFINLTDQTTHVEPTEKYLSFIGGRGINQWLLFNLVDKDVDALDPRNVLVLGAGIMVGTLAPSASRLAVDFKNALTGGIGSGNCGGRFAAEMKFAGYDHIVLLGKAPSPTYLSIENDMVNFRDASDMWGLGTWETFNRVKSRENRNGLSILSIGMAGEKLVKFASIIGDRGRAVGYGGAGAVMGSKNLKALAISGSRCSVEVAKPSEFIDLVRKLRHSVFEKSEVVKIHRYGGTLGGYVLPGEKKPHAVRNMKEEFWSNEFLQHMAREKFDAYLKRRNACFGCPSYCLGIFEVDGILCEGITANSMRGFGSNVDVPNAKAVLHAHALANSYGIDADHTGNVVAWAIECFEEGIIDSKDTDGLELKFGDGACVSELITKIAHREGIGDILARGIHEASEVIGKGSRELAVIVKKTAVMEAAMRSHKAWALGIVTSTKGSGHLRGAPHIEFARLPPETTKRTMGVDDISDPTSYVNKAALVFWEEKYKGVIDMLGICTLMTMWSDLNLFTPTDIAGLLDALTGQSYSPEELLTAGERLQNMERSFNLLHAGFGRQDDMPPEKLSKIPVNAGVFKGERLDEDGWNKMLDEYYDLHGWDKVTGWPTKERLSALGLDEVISRLAENGIILS